MSIKAKTKISAVILTKNEEDNIASCIKNVDFCDEVVIIDDKSIDNTREIAKSLGAKVFKRSLNKNYASQNKYAMQKANNEWVLFIDADERISKILRDEIEKAVDNSGQFSGYYFRRKDFLWGKWLAHGEIGAFKDLRLVRKGSGKWIRRVHQYFNVRGRTGEFKNPIEHYPHPTIGEFINNLNRWSSWHALANYEEGKKSNLVKATTFPVLKFIYNYFWRMGILDGIRGFVFAMLMSFHSYLSWSKLWIRQKKNN